MSSSHDDGFPMTILQPNNVKIYLLSHIINENYNVSVSKRKDFYRVCRVGNENLNNDVYN